MDPALQEKLEGLIRTFEEKNFMSMNNKYLPEKGIPDGFTYIVTYTTNGRQKTVAAASMGNQPNEFFGILFELETLLQYH